MRPAFETRAHLEELAERLAQLDAEAYNEFADLFGPQLLRLFRRRGLPQFEAEDLAATCITDIARKIEKYRSTGEGGFVNWVFKLAGNALADLWRERNPGRMVPLQENILAAEQPGGDSPPDMGVVLAVQAALKTLSVADRSILELRELGPQEKYNDIARELGIEPTTARVRHMRTLKRLERLLRRDPRMKARLDREKVRRAERSM
ncbi:MAG: sigma-70 family RNA polymerase sigma factor [Bryobacteraceae bacterium]|jgi:RNA polymerase sigma factor (sigma-70 family)